MIAPKRAEVRPRVVSPETGDALPLEEVIRDLMASQPRGAFRLVGPPGSGKTTALAHLASASLGQHVVFLDESDQGELIVPPVNYWIIATAASASEPAPSMKSYALAPWGEDEWIEYLLAAHKDRCQSVMNRLRSEPNLVWLQGNAQLWRLTLDQLAARESIPSVRAALLAAIAERFSSDDAFSTIQEAGFNLLLGQSSNVPAADSLLRHRPVQLLLAVRHVVHHLRQYASYSCLQHRLPRDLVRETAIEIAQDAMLIKFLVDALQGIQDRHAMAASILHAYGTNWVPPERSKLCLAGAYLDGANWPKLKLPGVILADADLSCCNWPGADLVKAVASRANFSHGNLQESNLRKIVANQADFTHANLTGSDLRAGFFDDADLAHAELRECNLRGASFAGANLTGASFRKANLCKVCFTGATIDEADFSEANLEGAILAKLTLRSAHFKNARLRGARLASCDLEEMELPKADFRDADLRNALLTGSSMRGACFDGACLAGAGLADIDWEWASLRGADLSKVSFHLGSSRCGLVGSPIACEGSRTGFYTDDFTEQDFKSPEEIRKANLCHADLRGAKINDVDFYLVDLRHARFDPHHIDHLRRCGAILHERTMRSG